MDEDFDIYGDLASNQEDEDEVIEDGKDAKNLREGNEILEKKLEELSLKLAEVEGENSQLKTNLSSLIKTAKAEITRKDRTITDLRSKLDNFTFRRNQRRTVEQNIAPPPPVNPLPQYENLVTNMYAYPPPPLGVIPFNNQHVHVNPFCFPPPQITFSDNNNQYDVNVEAEVAEEHIGFEDEAVDAEIKLDDEDVKVKQECPKTLYGERLRKRIFIEQESERKKKEAELKNREENRSDPRLQEAKKIEIKQEESRNSDIRQQEDENKKAKQEQEKIELRLEEERTNQFRQLEDKKKEQRYQEELKGQSSQHEEMKNVIKQEEEEEAQKNEIRTQENKRKQEQKNKMKQSEEIRNEMKQQEDKKAEDARRIEIRRQEDKKRDQRYQEELSRMREQEENGNEMRRQKEQNKIKLEQEKESEKELKEEKRNDSNYREDKKNHRGSVKNRDEPEQEEGDKPKVKQEETCDEDSKSGEKHQDANCGENQRKVRSDLVEHANNKENHRSFGNKSIQGRSNNLEENETSDHAGISDDFSDDNSRFHSVENSCMPKKDISSFDKYEGTNGSYICSKNHTNNRNYNGYCDSYKNKNHRNQNHYANNHRFNNYHKNEVSHRYSRQDMHQNQRFHHHRNSHKSSDRNRYKSGHYANRDLIDRRRSRSTDRYNKDISDRQRSRSSDRFSKDTNDRQRSKSSNRFNRNSRIKEQNYVQENLDINPYRNRDLREKQNIQSHSVVNTYHCRRDPRIRQNDQMGFNCKHHEKDNVLEDRSEEKLRKIKDSPKHRERSKSEEVISPRKKRRKEVDHAFIESMFASEAYEVPKKENVSIIEQKELKKALSINEKDNTESDKLSDKLEQVADKEKTVKNDKHKLSPVIETNRKIEIADVKETLVNRQNKNSNISNQKEQENILLKTDCAKHLVSDAEEGEITFDNEDLESLNNRLKSLQSQLDKHENDTLNPEIDEINAKLTSQQKKSNKSTKFVSLNKEICKPDEKEKVAESKNQEKEQSLDTLMPQKDSASYFENPNSRNHENSSKNKRLNGIKCRNRDSDIKNKPSEEKYIEKSTSNMLKHTKNNKKSEEKVVMKPHLKEDKDLSDLSTKIDTSSKKMNVIVTKRVTHKTNVTRHTKIKEIEKPTLNTANALIHEKNSKINNEMQNKADVVSKPEDQRSHPSEKLIKNKSNTEKEKIIKSNKNSEKSNRTETKKKELHSKTDSDILMKQVNKKSSPTKKVVENTLDTKKIEDTKLLPDQKSDKLNNCIEAKKKESHSKIDRENLKRKHKKSCSPEKVVENKVSLNTVENAKSQLDQDIGKNDNCTETKQKVKENKMNTEKVKNDKSQLDQEAEKNDNCTETKPKVKAEKLQSKETINNHSAPKKPAAKPCVEFETPAKRRKIDLTDAIKTVIPKSQLGKNVIIVRRRRRPVQLADSPAVLVVKDGSLNKSK